MSELPDQLKPRPNDVRFTRYREPGDPGCLCSRCLQSINENTQPIIYFSQSHKWLFRFHPRCLGIETFE